MSTSPTINSPIVTYTPIEGYNTDILFAFFVIYAGYLGYLHLKKSFENREISDQDEWSDGL